MSVGSFLYFITSPQEERELAYLEASVLLNEKVQTPFHFTAVALDISESAYLKLCGLVLQAASSFSELLQKILEANYLYDEFRIEIHESVRTRKDLESHIKGVIAVADVLKKGNPNLENPKIILDVVADESGYFFLKRHCINSNSWRRHIRKPYSFSSSLSARYSRALVNIACFNGKNFLDPCCGFGNVVLEAAYLGYQAAGNDLNKKQVWYAEQNLAHFGFPMHIMQEDALTLLPEGAVDAVVVDFPYGLNSQPSDDFYQQFLFYYHTRVKRLVTLTNISIEAMLQSSNYQILGTAVMTKGHRFQRHVALAVPI